MERPMRKLSGSITNVGKLGILAASITVLSVTAFVTSCNDTNGSASSNGNGQPGSGNPGNTLSANGTTLGSVANGKTVFRSETFGDEGFWTDAARLPQGITAAQVTPVQALQLGLSVNVDALDAATQAAVGAEIKAQGTNGPLLNSFATTIKLLNANAIIGVVAKDSSNLGHIDVTNGSKVGVSCVLCHAITNGSVYSMPNGGSIGSEVDGPANHNLAVGKILAVAANTRAFFPMAQLMGVDGTSLGRAPSEAGLTVNSTEADFDAYFSNPDYYPVGMFDDTDDGNGDPMHITPMFRQDLAAPYGSGGELSRQDHFANTVFTALLDPTNLLSAGGRTFLHTVGGANGDALANNYAAVLAATGVYPKGSPQAEAADIPTFRFQEPVLQSRRILCLEFGLTTKSFLI